MPARNPAGTVYGILVVGALLAAEGSANVRFVPLIGATVVALALYWLAHAYAAVLGQRLQSADRWSPRLLLGALAHERALLRGGAAPILVLVVAGLSGADLNTGVNLALASCAVMMLSLELLAGVGEGLSVVEVITEATVGAVLGIGLFVVRILVH